MLSLRRQALLLLVVVALSNAVLTAGSRSRAKLAFDESPSHTFTQLAQCYPSTTPCHAGRVLGKRLAKSTAYFVVTQRGSFKSGLTKVKKWIRHAHKHHIDKHCLLKSFRRYYKKFYRRYKHRCPCRHHHKRGVHHRHGHKHHHGRHHHVKHHHGRHHHGRHHHGRHHHGRHHHGRHHHGRHHHVKHHHGRHHHRHGGHHHHIKVHVHHRGHHGHHHHHVHHHKYHHHHHRAHHRGHHHIRHHHGHKHHGHKHHHHKRHHIKKRLSPAAKALAKTVTRTLAIKVKFHKKQTKHFKRKELKWQKKLYTAKSLVVKTKCQAKISHFKRRRSEVIIKITREKVRARKVKNGGKCGCKSLRKRLAKQVRRRDSYVRKEQRAYKVSVRTIRKEIRLLHKKARKADVKTRAHIYKKLVVYRATRRSCHKALIRVRSVEVRHKKHAVQSLTRRIRYCKSSSKKEILRARLVKRKFSLQKVFSRRVAEKRSTVSRKQKSLVRIEIRIKRINKKISTASGKKKIHFQHKLIKYETKKRVCKRAIKHCKKAARRFNKKAKKATRTHNAHFFKAKIETKRAHIRKWQTEYKQAKSKTMRRKCHRKILHFKRVVAIARVKQLRHEIHSARRHHMGTHTLRVKLYKAEKRRTHCLRREVSINRKHASHFSLKIKTLRKAKKETKGTARLTFLRKIGLAKVKLHACHRRESKVISLRVRIATRDIKRVERKIARVTSVKARVKLLSILKRKQKSYKSATKCKTHLLKRKANRNIKKAHRLKHRISILKVRISKAKGSERTRLITKLAVLKVTVKVCKKRATKEKRVASKLTKRAKSSVAVIASSCLPKIHRHHHHTVRHIKKTKVVELRKVSTLKRLLKSATGHQKRSIVVRLVKHEKKLLKANKLQVGKETKRINIVIRRYEKKIHILERRIKHTHGHKRVLLVVKLRHYEKKEKAARRLKKEIKIFTRGSVVTRLHKVHGCSCCGPQIKKVNAKIKAIQVSALEVENKYAKILIKKARKTGGLHHRHHGHHHVKHSHRHHGHHHRVVHHKHHHGHHHHHVRHHGHKSHVHRHHGHRHHGHKHHVHHHVSRHHGHKHHVHHHVSRHHGHKHHVHHHVSRHHGHKHHGHHAHRHHGHHAHKHHGHREHHHGHHAHKHHGHYGHKHHGHHAHKHHGHHGHKHHRHHGHKKLLI